MEKLSWFGEVQRERWGELLGFVEGWRVGIGDADGVSEEVIGEAEGRLGVRLPEALREWYRIGGKRDDLVRVQNQLLRPSELYVDEGHLVFYSENQGVVRWGIPVGTLSEDDPVVWIDREYMGRQSHTMRRDWLDEGKPVSAFIFQMIVLETGFARETAGMFPVKVSMFKRLQRLMRMMEKFWSHDWPGDPTYFFGDVVEIDKAEIIVVDIGFRDLLVIGKDEAAFVRARKLLRLR